MSIEKTTPKSIIDLVHQREQELIEENTGDITDQFARMCNVHAYSSLIHRKINETSQRIFGDVEQEAHRKAQNKQKFPLKRSWNPLKMIRSKSNFTDKLLGIASGVSTAFAGLCHFFKPELVKPFELAGNATSAFKQLPSEIKQGALENNQHEKERNRNLKAKTDQNINDENNKFQEVIRKAEDAQRRKEEAIKGIR